MSHLDPRSPADFKRYPSRLRRTRLPSRASPGAMGPNVYRAQWMAQICLAIMGSALILGALPSLRSLSGVPALYSGLELVAQLAAASALLFYGVRRQVALWPSTLSIFAIACGFLLLPLYWAHMPMSLPPWLAAFLPVGVCGAVLIWGAGTAAFGLGLLCALVATFALWFPLTPQLQSDLIVLVIIVKFSLLASGLVSLYLRTAEDADTDYSAAIAHATALRRSRTQSEEQERLDRLIHDNVMAALLDASRTEGPVSKRTRELARRALSVLEFEEKRATGTATTYVHQMMDDLLEALTPWRSRVRFSFLVHQIRPAGLPRAFLPSDTAQALIHAVTEAVSNSARHSGTDVTFVTMDGGTCPPTRRNPGGFFLIFEVLDHGRGFQTRSIDSRRLGVRVSIVGNVENAGGRVEIATVPHRGTQIRIVWPHDAQLTA